MSEQILAPGDYVIELGFNRALEDGALVRALNGMGFVNITPDTTDVSTGAVATLGKRKLPTSAKPAPSAAPKAPVALRTVAKTLTQARAVNPAATSRAVPVVLRPAVVTKPTLPGTVKPPLPGSQGNTLGKRKLPTPGQKPAPPAPKPGTPEYIPYLEKVLASAIAAGQKPEIVNAIKARLAAAKNPPKMLGKRKAPGASAQPSDTAIGPDAAPGDGGLVEDSGEGGGGGGGGEGGSDGGSWDWGGAPAASDEAASAEPPPAAYAAPPEPPPAADPTSYVLDLWRRWAEWGSPFAQGPSTSGEGDDNRFRFVARLKKPIRVRDLPGMTWLYVRRLSIQAFGGEDFRWKEHTLNPGKYYEFRVLSRDKSTPTREDVKKALVETGFAPMKLSVLKRHMRVPFRPNVSATLWTGFAQWGRGKSVISSEDPLFFIDLKEVVP